MAILPRRQAAPPAAAPISEPAQSPPTAAIAPIEGSQPAATVSPAPLAATAAASTTTVAPAAPPLDDFAAGVAKEAALMAFLQSPAAKEALDRVNPKLAEKALRCAALYVSNRSDPVTWRALVDASPKSVLDAVTKLAAGGLCVSQITGEAFLTPRFSKADQCVVAVGIPGVRGMEQIICASPKIGTIDGNVIRAQDHCVIKEGLNPVLDFTRNMTPDLSKPNPVIGAYVCIPSTDGRPPKIKTVTIEETITKKGVYEIESWKVDGELLNTGRMGIDAAGVYACQRPAMREIARTWLRDNEALNSLVEMENTSLRTGEEIAGTQPRIRGGNSRAGVPSVATANTPTANGHTNGHAAPSQSDPVTAAIEKARVEVPAEEEANLSTAMRRLGPRIM